MKRWMKLDRVLIVVLALLVFFAWMDSQQILSFLIINTPEAWELYLQHTGPAIWQTWYFVLGIIGIMWYIIYKDKSEALALASTGWILIWFGVQDLIYFAFSSQTLADIGCWANMMPPVRIISDLLGECCPTAKSFTLSAIIGLVIAYYSYNWLKRQRSW